MNVLFIPRSNNKKLGPIPVSILPKQTCPSTCPLKDNGCYAGSGAMNVHWLRVTKSAAGIPWNEFLKKIQSLPKGTLWRYAEAGDLPGVGDKINFSMLLDLVLANLGKRGFTYTHKPLVSENIRRIRMANQDGFVVNLSADCPALADELFDAKCGPVVTLVRKGTPDVSKTPRGRKVVICPAQTRAGVTCRSCQICAKPERDYIIGFLPHGSGRSNGGQKVDRLVAQLETACAEKGPDGKRTFNGAADRPGLAAALR